MCFRSFRLLMHLPSLSTINLAVTRLNECCDVDHSWVVAFIFCLIEEFLSIEVLGNPALLIDLSVDQHQACQTDLMQLKVWWIVYEELPANSGCWTIKTFSSFLFKAMVGAIDLSIVQTLSTWIIFSQCCLDGLLLTSSDQRICSTAQIGKPPCS